MGGSSTSDSLKANECQPMHVGIKYIWAQAKDMRKVGEKDSTVQTIVFRQTTINNKIQSRVHWTLNIKSLRRDWMPNTFTSTFHSCLWAETLYTVEKASWIPTHHHSLPQSPALERVQNEKMKKGSDRMFSARTTRIIDTACCNGHTSWLPKSPLGPVGKWRLHRFHFLVPGVDWMALVGPRATSS